MRTRKGFTIVEVSLVVAIGGLILVGALVAVPNLLRLARDSQRKTDMEKLVSALKKYQTNNNRGALPDINNLTEWNDFYHNFLGDNFADPNEPNYRIIISNCTSSLGTTCGQVTNTGFGASLFNSEFPNGYVMFVMTSAKCQDNDPIRSSNQRKFAVLYRLETNDLFCLDG